MGRRRRFELLARGIQRERASYVTRLLAEVGVGTDVIRVEQFGATGWCQPVS
jgi:hypothetical protein